MKKLVLAFCAAALAAPLFAGNVYYASPDGTSGGAGTLEDPYDAETAVGKARSGDEVRLLDGTYYLTVPAVAVTSWNNGVLKPSSGVTIRGWIADGDKPALGDLRDRVVLDTQQTGRCFHMDNASNWMVIRDLVVTNACPAWRESDHYSYFNGGGVYLNGSAEGLVTNCAFRGCVTKYSEYGVGAGAYIAGSSRIVDCEFSGCTGCMRGVALALSDTAVGINCRCFNNAIDRQMTNNGGAVFLGGSAELYDSVITNNTSESEGGGLYASGSGFCCSNVYFAANGAKHYGGGAAYVTGSGAFLDCIFERNWATHEVAERSMGGGAVQIMGGESVFSNCEFRANTATRYGAAINALTGNPTVGTCGFSAYGCTFADNVAGAAGGAIRLMSYSEGLGLYGCTFTNNLAGSHGGAVYVAGPFPIGNALRLPVVDCVFEDNVATNCGGAFYSGADDWARHGFVGGFTNCVFRGGRAYHGGAVYAMGDFKGCTFEGNRAAALNGTVGDSKGGAVYLQANGGNPQSGVTTPEATNCVHFADCAFLANTINFRSSSGVYCQYGDVVFERCRFVGNVSEQNQGVDGGAAAVGVAKKVNSFVADACEFRANASGGYGAAIGFELSGSLLASALIRNCLFASNTNRLNGGGALALSKNTRVESCTFAGNRAGDMGGAVRATETENSLTINCLFADNASGNSTTAADCDISPEAYRNSCVSNCYSKANSFPAEALNIGGGDPLFADAAKGDYRLQKKSPCVNAGTNQVWMTGARDLQNSRKVNRIMEDVVDIGCYEYRMPPGLLLWVR